MFGFIASFKFLSRFRLFRESKGIRRLLGVRFDVGIGSFLVVVERLKVSLYFDIEIDGYFFDGEMSDLDVEVEDSGV